MAEVFGYVSSKEIINRLYSGTGIQEALPYNDLIEWIYQVFEKIGYPSQYIPKIMGWKENEAFKFESFICPLPEDFHSLRQIAVNGVAARPSDSSFLELLDGGCCSDISLIPDSAFDQFTDNFGNVLNTNIGNDIFTNGAYGVGVTFTITNKMITFNIKKGKMCLAYWAIPVDEDGFPMIPDLERYKTAVEMYLRMKIDYIAWRQDPSNRGRQAIYKDSQQEYEWYVASAIGYMKTPSIGEMENIKNSLLRLKPRIQEYNKFWKTLGANNGIK